MNKTLFQLFYFKFLIHKGVPYLCQLKKVKEQTIIDV